MTIDLALMEPGMSDVVNAELLTRPRDFDDDRDDDARRDDIDARRERFNGCKCGNPDMPGYCPGWRNCPMHGEPTSEENDNG